MHNLLKNGLEPFRPILSVIGTPNHKLVTCLVPIFFDITKDQFMVQNSFKSADKILTLNNDPDMAG